MIFRVKWERGGDSNCSEQKIGSLDPAFLFYNFRQVKTLQTNVKAIIQLFDNQRMNVWTSFINDDSFQLLEEPKNQQEQKQQASTNDFEQQELIGEKDLEDKVIQIEEKDPFWMQEENSLEVQVEEIFNKEVSEEKNGEMPSKEKKISKKNSNAIKKYGRMIIPRINLYKVNGKLNKGMTKMMEMLEQKKKDKKTLKDKKDGFNTSHLKAMFNSCSPQEASHNLTITRKIFSSTLRNEVFESIQIPENNRVLYLNTLKCAALRFSSKTLALRLQLSQNP